MSKRKNMTKDNKAMPEEKLTEDPITQKEEDREPVGEPASSGKQEQPAPEAEAPQAAEEAGASAPEALRKDLEATKALLREAAKKQEEYLTMAQRVQADFENFRRRNQNVRKESYDDGLRDLAKDFLPVMDNLERAIAAAQNSPDESLKSGVELVQRQMNEVLDKRGIKAISRIGEAFDPNLENAVMRGTPEEGGAGTVCAVFQKGYEMGGKLIRPAMVKVVPEN